MGAQIHTDNYSSTVAIYIFLVPVSRYFLPVARDMVRELCSRCTLPRKYGPTSIAKGFSTTSPMRIMDLLGDILGDYLHTNRGKIEISQVFMEI